jgi:hypothetical protein
VGMRGHTHARSWIRLLGSRSVCGGSLDDRAGAVFVVMPSGVMGNAKRGVIVDGSCKSALV